MKIVAYYNLYLPDHCAGAQTMLRDLLRPLRDQGRDVSVLIQHQGKRREPYLWEGIWVYPPADKRVPLHHIPRADVVITSLETTTRAALIAEKWRVPVVQLVHNERPGLRAWLQRRCDLAVFNSQWVSDAVGYYKGPRMVIYPPVDPAEYKTTSGKKVTLVNLWPDKGSETFYACARQMPDVDFLGVRGGYGPQDIRQMANVEIGEHTTDPTADVYAQTKIILMPSVYESWGRVAVEALASGIPTIAHPTPGLREALGDAGIFVDRDDHAGWVREIRRLLTPRAYGEARKKALARSESLDAARRTHLRMWTDGVAMAAQNKGRTP